LSTGSFYASDENVVELTQEKFRDFVFDKDYASIVEFYSSYCSACRRYSYTWKSFALDISPWNDIVKVAVVECSEDDEFSKEYGIQYFPSIRYFSPNLKQNAEEKQHGIQSMAREISVMKALTVNYLQSETNVPAHWPNLTPLEDVAEPEHIFDNISDEVKYVVLVYPGLTNVHIGYEFQLDYHKDKEILIKQINSTEVANKFGIESKATVHVVGRDLKVVALPTEIYNNYNAVKRILEKYLTDHGVVFQKQNNSTIG